MNILFLSCHQVLEFDEVSLLVELGHDVFSHGAYRYPGDNPSLLRNGIKGLKRHDDLIELSTHFPKTNLAQEMIDFADVIIVMHTPEWVTGNWDRIKHKKVVWRSIGQSNASVENQIRKMHYEGLKIIRYSPAESYLPGYLGADALIRFYKDPEEFGNWNGENKKVINFTQSLKARRNFCHYDDIMKITDGFPTVIYGPGNDDLGPLNGGELPYNLMKGALRDNRAFLYTGTWPACYTLAFMEAMMTGIPIVAIGSELAETVVAPPDRFKFYEVNSLIENGVNGFIADDIGQLRGYLHELLENHDLAKRIGDAGRQKAIEYFGKEKIKSEWKIFLDNL